MHFFLAYSTVWKLIIIPTLGTICHIKRNNSHITINDTASPNQTLKSEYSCHCSFWRAGGKCCPPLSPASVDRSGHIHGRITGMWLGRQGPKERGVICMPHQKYCRFGVGFCFEATTLLFLYPSLQDQLKNCYNSQTCFQSHHSKDTSFHNWQKCPTLC